MKAVRISVKRERRTNGNVQLQRNPDAKPAAKAAGAEGTEAEAAKAAEAEQQPVPLLTHAEASIARSRPHSGTHRRHSRAKPRGNPNGCARKLYGAEP